MLKFDMCNIKSVILQVLTRQGISMPIVLLWVQKKVQPSQDCTEPSMRNKGG